MLKFVSVTIVWTLFSMTLGLPTLQRDTPPPKISNRSPILMFPGLTGSQIEVHHQVPPDDPDSECNTDHYESLWLNKERFGIHVSDDSKCLEKEIKLDYDKTTGYSYFANVEARALDFGFTDGIEFLDPEKKTKALHDFVQYFSERGYTRNMDIRAAPYDWRMAADELERHHSYYNNVRELIEHMYKDSGNKKVTLICFSLGCPTSYYLLTQYESTSDQAWKEKYIHTYVTVVGGWDGGVVGLDSLIAGGAPGELGKMISSLDPYSESSARKFIRSVVGTMQSMYTIIPKSSVWGNEILISFTDKQYNARQYKDLFEDLNLENSFSKFEGVENLYGGYDKEPGVPTVCVYGTNVLTPIKYEYQTSTSELVDKLGDYDNLVKVYYGDGDGIVNVENAETCLKWQNQSAGFRSETCECKPHTIGCGDEMLKWVEEVVNLDLSPESTLQGPSSLAAEPITLIPEPVTLVPEPVTLVPHEANLMKQSLLRELLDNLVQEMVSEE